MAKQIKKKCVRRGCKNEANGYRGLCLACYRAAYSLVHEGKTTWEDLERKKLVATDARISKARQEFLKA